MRGVGSKRLRGSIWWIRYWHRGKEYAESTHSPDPRVADKLLKKRLGEREAGKFHGTKQERVAYEQLKDYIRTDYTKRGLRSIDTLAARFAHLDAAFAGMRAVDITPAHLHTYQADRRTAGAEAATVNRELAALRRMFQLAAELLVLTVVPVFPKPLEENAPRQGFYEPSEVQAIRAHLHEDYQDVMDALYVTGQRKRAIVGLTWGDVFLDSGEIRLDAARMKSKRVHVLPIGADLLAVLQRRLKARRLDLALVFHHRGQPIGDWRKSWAHACDDAGLPGKLLHDFRRTAARDLRHSGVSEKEAMQHTGHATASVFKRYQIVTPTEQRAVADRLTAYRAAQPTTATVVPMKRADGASS
jgi:integrase